MDEFDQAQRLEEQDRERALRSLSRRPARTGTDDCIECGNPIDVARKVALPSATRCVDCQGLHELKTKMKRR